MADWLNSKVINQLESALNATNLRNKVLADNIANIDTPNFKRSDVNFQAVLAESMSKDQSLALRKTSTRHLTGDQFFSRVEVVQDNSTTYRNDGNNVDIDLEMTRLAENTLQYNALAHIYSSQLNLLRQVVRE